LSVAESNTSGTSLEAARVDHTHSGVTSITGTSNQVIASSSIGGVILSLPQSIATTNTVQFGGLTVQNNFAITTPVYQFYSVGGSAESTLIPTPSTYYALTDAEVSFTPQFIGQRFLLTFTGYASLNTTVIQYCFVRATITNSTNTVEEILGFSRSDNFGTSGRGTTVAFTKIWSSNNTQPKKFKLYGTTQTTSNLTLTLGYTQITAISLN
jgi:hypothetical protein